MRAVEPGLSNGMIVGRLARNADPAGDPANDPDVQLKFGNGRVNMARALADTSLEEIKPAGAEPVGDGGPYVGPYKIAALGIAASWNNSTTTITATASGVQTNNKYYRFKYTPPGGPSSTTLTGCSLAPSDPFNNTRTLTAPFTNGTWNVCLLEYNNNNDCTGDNTGNNFNKQECTNVSVVGKADQTITVTTPAPATAVYNTSFTVAATASSGLPVAYSSAGVCTNVGATFTMTSGTGTCTVKYDQAGNDNYNAAPQVTESVTAQKANAVISVTPYDVTYDGNAHTATGSATGVKGEALSGLNVSGTTHTNAGDYTADPWTFTDVTGNYNNTSGAVHDKIAKANAVINVVGYTGTYDGNAHGASGTATGVGGVDISGSLNLGSTFTNVPGGTAHWTFTNSNYNDQSGDVAIVINKANQTINFGSLTDKTAGDPAFDVSATATSGLTVSFSSLTTSVCTVSGNTVTLTNTAGTCAIRASQGGDDNYNAAPNVDQSFKVNPGPAFAFSVVASKSGLPISSVTAGDSFDVTVTAKDQYNNTATGYTGTVHFTSNDAKAVLPSDSIFASGDNGSRTFSAVVLKTSGEHQWIGAMDTVTSITGTTQDINVGPASANTFLVDTPANATAGTAFDVKVTVQDAYGNTVTYYTGTVHFTSTDTNASVVLPVDYTFKTGTGEDNGVHTFHETTLITAPTQTITVADASITVVSANINVMPGALDHFTFANISSPQTALNPFSVTITAKDAYENTVTLFTETVDLTITSGSSISPVTSGNFVGGAWTGDLTISGAGTDKQITATNSSGTETGTSNSFDVDKAAATVTLGSLAPTYDGTPKSATATTNPVGLTVDFTYDGSSTPPTNAGSYAVVGTINDANYQGSATGTMVIGKADSTTTVTVAGGESFTYDGNAHPATVSVTGDGGLNLTPAPVYSCEHAPINVVDSGCVASYTFAGDDNHYGSSDSKTYTISKADPVVTATGNTCTYNGSPCTGSGSATGVKGETLTPVNVAYKDALGNLLTSAPVNAGSYQVAARYAGDANYNQKQSAAVPLTIEKADSVTVVTVAGGESFTYDGNAHPATVSVTGAGGLNLTPAPVYSCEHAPINVVDSGCIASYIYAGDDNHDGSSDSKTYTINPAPLTITANNRTKTYGHAVTFAGTEFTIIGLVNGDLVTSVTLTSSGALATAPLGSYAIEPSVAVGSGLGNYTITYVNGTLTIQMTGFIIPIEVTLHTVDQKKSGVCGTGPNGKVRGECKGGPDQEMIAKVFDMKNPAFQAAYGKSPGNAKYEDIYNSSSIIGLNGLNTTCPVDAIYGEGLCSVTGVSDYLVIVKYEGPANIKYPDIKYPSYRKVPIYAGKKVSAGSFQSRPTNTEFQGPLRNVVVPAGTLWARDVDIHLGFHILRTINKDNDERNEKDGRCDYGDGARSVYSGSYLEIIYPSYTVWEEGVTDYLYPFILTGDTDWTVDVCASVPQGYQIVGDTTKQPGTRRNNRGHIPFFLIFRNIAGRLLYAEDR
jgi:hypothetical protein